MSGADKIVRRRVVYSGRVQGVGFRYTCHELARDFSIVGFVRNVPDGTVELEAQGHGVDVERFLGRIAEHRAGFIRECVTTALDPTASEVAFVVRA